MFSREGRPYHHKDYLTPAILIATGVVALVMVTPWAYENSLHGEWGEIPQRLATYIFYGIAQARDYYGDITSGKSWDEFLRECQKIAETTTKTRIPKILHPFQEWFDEIMKPIDQLG